MMFAILKKEQSQIGSAWKAMDGRASSEQSLETHKLNQCPDGDRQTRCSTLNITNHHS